MPEACAKRFHLQIYVYIYLWVLRRGGVKGGLSGKKGAWSQPRRLVTFLHKRTQFSMRIWVRANRLWILPLVLALVLATCQCVVNFSWKGGVKSPPRLSFSLLKELQAGLGGCQFYSIIFPQLPLFVFELNAVVMGQQIAIVAAVIRGLCAWSCCELAIRSVFSQLRWQMSQNSDTNVMDQLGDRTGGISICLANIFNPSVTKLWVSIG